MLKPTIRDHADHEVDDLATFCPKCGESRIDKGNPSGQDFDENGWFATAHFRCMSPKCGHTWTNKVMLASGGTTIRYA